MFSLICKKRMIPRGKTVSFFSKAWDYEEIYPFLLAIFLSDRTFQVHLGSILSETMFHQEEGVPRGAILSTTLFNVTINDIVKQIDPGVECEWLCYCVQISHYRCYPKEITTYHPQLRKHGPLKMVHWISLKSFLLQNGVQNKQLY